MDLKRLTAETEKRICLASSQQEKAIKAILANDEASSDQQLIDHLVKEIGISREEAKRWVAKRSQFLNRI